MRAPYVDKNGIKKGAWSEEEDQKLRDYILRYGHWNWRLLPKYAGLARCGKSCRLRWLNYLKPGVKLGNFSKEEAELIARQHDEYGNKWSLIATSLPGRTDNEIKNYWHTHLKKRGRAEKTTSPSENPVQNSAQSINCGYRSQVASCVTTSQPAPKLPRKVENLQSYDVHILESSSGSSNSLSLARPVKWDPDDHSASSSLSSVQQPIIGAETRDGRMEDFQDERDERGSSSYSFAGLPENLWTEQLLMATSYSPDGGFASMPLDDESFLQEYLLS